ncbi:hypothetical protein [Tabrizicola soli]|uniref:Uncharacterized protein n=1 Tax=Tabrizicola soli TaxID=2185115 RepID=A0ABV7DZK2_9RHOB|nr:hypothetical protein [Tabrizicola soli]
MVTVGIIAEQHIGPDGIQPATSVAAQGDMLVIAHPGDEREALGLSRLGPFRVHDSRLDQKRQLGRGKHFAAAPHGKVGHDKALR